MPSASSFKIIKNNEFEYVHENQSTGEAHLHINGFARRLILTCTEAKGNSEMVYSVTVPFYTSTVNSVQIPCSSPCLKSTVFLSHPAQVELTECDLFNIFECFLPLENAEKYTCS